ncbi:PTS system mannose/fructose/sorbose family transporter subunit IID [Pediococcus damnosus]|nr:PTS system mannose/fructose/sorbose family transporter subunit IID [Pediococcus damnosus]AMV62181.1 PTS system, mannose-specific IID component [Pediococcus damnosus]AMV70154.1 PTS system, mannose-specific IID component [Pediococcus damnosus]KRN52500.1 PTS system, IID component [Pediococcus damnosus]GEA92815.1 PTS N-acetylglucosamine transporter subunit IIABC [Pediococcus damnosus]
MSDNQTFKLSKKDKEKVFWRYTIVGNSLFNYASIEAPSLVYALSPALRKIYKNDDDYKASLKNQYKYFNTTPIMAESLIGASLAMEEKNGIKALEPVQSLKTSLMGPFAGIGDSIFNVMLNTIIGSITGSLALSGNLVAPVLIGFVWAMIMLFGVKRPLFWGGYNSGIAIVDKFGDQLSRLTDAASVLGVTVVGSLIPTVIKIQTGLTMKTGKVSTNIQSGMLDQIMPALLPVVATFIIYKLLNNKKWTPTKCIFLVIVFALVCSFFGILTVPK